MTSVLQPIRLPCCLTYGHDAEVLLEQRPTGPCATLAWQLPCEDHLKPEHIVPGGQSAQDTGGTYGVALNERHFEELVFEHAPPPPSLAGDASASLVGGPSSSEALLVNF